MIVLVILGIAVARLTRLWRDDSITGPIRDWVSDWSAPDDGEAHPVRYWILDMLECPWCLSGWLSIAAVVVTDSATSRSVPLPFISWLVVWWVACFGYWLLELVADYDALAWNERVKRGIDDSADDPS